MSVLIYQHRMDTFMKAIKPSALCLDYAISIITKWINSPWITRFGRRKTKANEYEIQKSSCSLPTLGEKSWLTFPNQNPNVVLCDEELSSFTKKSTRLTIIRITIPKATFSATLEVSPKREEIHSGNVVASFITPEGKKTRDKRTPISRKWGMPPDCTTVGES